MGVRILEDADQGYKVLYCSTTMVPFGSIFYEHEDVDSFLEFINMDARNYTQKELSAEVDKWRLNN